MARKMDQFRDGSLGRKLLPNPKYFHIGLGGLSGLEDLGSTLGVAIAGYRDVSRCVGPSDWGLGPLQELPAVWRPPYCC